VSPNQAVRASEIVELVFGELWRYQPLIGAGLRSIGSDALVVVAPTEATNAVAIS
jgi:hypothetical protein